MRIGRFFRADTAQTIASDAWHQLITDGGYKAVVFDCDGTLVESGEAHYQAFSTAFQAQGFAVDRAWYDARTGLDRQSIIAAFAKTHDGFGDIDAAVAASLAAYIADCTSTTAIPETISLLGMLQGHLKLGVATNSEHEVALASLGQVGIQDSFDAIMTVSGGHRPKPAPDLFNAAVNALGVPAAETLVFEDSNEGVQAAMAAGLDVVQVLPE